MTPPRLRAFLDAELVRAPMAADMAFQATIEALTRGTTSLAPAERKVVSDLLLAVAAQRPRLVERFVASLREQVHAELAQAVPVRLEKGPKPALALSLVDDEEVAVDVAMSHTIEAIKSVAEHEQRELLAYTSALVGDMDVGADHNPLRAETQARALWMAAQALPLSRGHQLALMRHAAMPLAQTLRKTYAAACARLESEGTEPAAYRTVIPPAGPRTRRVLDLSITQPIRGIAAEATRSRFGAIAEAPQGEAAQQIAALVGRLFEAMLSDRRLPTAMHAPMTRMQAFVLKAALEEPAILDDDAHPVWRFIDLLAYYASVNPGPDDEELDFLLRFTARLLDQLGEEARQTRSLYQWAIERLERYAAKRLADRAAIEQEQIATMQQLEDKLARPDAPISTFHGAIDLPQLDTVPADLLDEAPPPDEDPARWVAALRAGDWLRMFHQGRWIHCQLVWPGDRGEIWLFGDGASDHSFAIRRSALQRLRETRLAEHTQPRSLLADARAALARGRG